MPAIQIDRIHGHLSTQNNQAFVCAEVTTCNRYANLGTFVSLVLIITNFLCATHHLDDPGRVCCEATDGAGSRQSKITLGKVLEGVAFGAV
jgi:hypothetical protein